MSEPANVYKLSPSDFAFLWEQCRRCFYLKATRGIRQPSMPMAGVFKRIEGLQMTFYDGRPTREVSADLPPGVVRCGEKWLESEVIRPRGRKSGAYVVGKLDSLVEFEDRSWGVLDFKTTEAKGAHLALYGRQLNAYAYSLERPAASPRSIRGMPPRLSPVSKVGLLCFSPSSLVQPVVGRQSYEGEVKWVELRRDDAAFEEFVGEILGVLEGPMPPPAPDCDWCKYVQVLGGAGAPTAAPGAPAPAGGSACPRCGSPMVQRSGRYGAFLSCTRYPECRGTRNLS